MLFPCLPKSTPKSTPWSKTHHKPLDSTLDSLELVAKCCKLHQVAIHIPCHCRTWPPVVFFQCFPAGKKHRQRPDAHVDLPQSPGRTPFPVPATYPRALGLQSIYDWTLSWHPVPLSKRRYDWNFTWKIMMCVAWLRKEDQ